MPLIDNTQTLGKSLFNNINMIINKLTYYERFFPKKCLEDFFHQKSKKKNRQSNKKLNRQNSKKKSKKNSKKNNQLGRSF